MFLARNNVKLTGTYSDASFANIAQTEPIAKLSIRVKNGTALLQVAESIPATFPDDGQDETELEAGIHSLSPVTEWTGFRFKLSPGSTGVTVSFRAYG